MLDARFLHLYFCSVDCLRYRAYLFTTTFKCSSVFQEFVLYLVKQFNQCQTLSLGCIFTTVPSIRVSRVVRVSRVRVTLTVTVRLNRVSVMVNVGDSIK